MELVLKEVAAERKRQDDKWGIQNHHPMVWLSILGEEFGEVCRAAYECSFHNNDKYKNYREELIQVAAVAVAMVESIDRNPEP